MPVAHFHIVDGVYSDQQRRTLLAEASRIYADVLGSPIDRVRVFAVRYSPGDVAVGGDIQSEGCSAAPYFTAIVLAGRPVEQRRELAARFTDLLVDIIGAQKELIRGQIIEVDPEKWFIGGTAAAETRRSEIAARAHR